MKSFRRIAPYFVGVLAVVVAYIPTLRMNVGGDDLYLLFQSQSVSNGNLLEWMRVCFIGGISQGHFKPLGHMLDGLFQFLAYPVSVFFGTPLRWYYFVEGLLFLVAIMFAATWFFRLASRVLRAKSKPEHGVSFLVLCIITGASLQLHPWSGDPMTTFIAWGLGSTLFAFITLSLTLKALDTVGAKRGILFITFAAVAGMISMLIYEMLIAVVLAQLVIISAYILSNRQTARARWALAGRTMLPILGAPLLVFGVGRVLARLMPGEPYSGTEINLSFAGIKATLFGLLGLIPGASWPLSLKYAPVSQTSWLVLIGLVILVPIFATGFWALKTGTPGRSSVKSLAPTIVIVFSLGLLAVGSVATQTFTTKYIEWISQPGYIYLFYSLGSVCVSVILTVLITRIRPRALISFMGVLIFVFIFWFSSTQFLVNWNLRQTDTIRTEFDFALTSKSIPNQQRCTILEKWAAIGWDDYYRQGIVPDSQKAFSLYHQGQEVCSPKLEAK